MYCPNCVYGQDRANILGLRSSGCSLSDLKWSQIVKFTSVIREEIKGGGEVNNTSSWNLIPVISTRRGGMVRPVLKSVPYIGRISYASMKEPNWRFRALHFNTNLNCSLRCVAAKSNLRLAELFSNKSNHTQSVLYLQFSSNIFSNFSLNSNFRMKVLCEDYLAYNFIHVPFWDHTVK